MAVLGSIAVSIFSGIGNYADSCSQMRPWRSRWPSPSTRIRTPSRWVARSRSRRSGQIVRDDGGLYAVRLICTHLGCTPNYVTNVTSGTGVADEVAKEHGERKPPEQAPNGWACPCHGSRYFIELDELYGPAPRPMDWVDLQFGPSGKLVVDRGTLVVMRGAGETTEPKGWHRRPGRTTARPSVCECSAASRAPTEALCPLPDSHPG